MELRIRAATVGEAQQRRLCSALYTGHGVSCRAPSRARNRQPCGISSHDYRVNHHASDSRKMGTFSTAESDPRRSAHDNRPEHVQGGAGQGALPAGPLPWRTRCRNTSESSLGRLACAEINTNKSFASSMAIFVSMSSVRRRAGKCSFSTASALR